MNTKDNQEAEREAFESSNYSNKLFTMQDLDFAKRDDGSYSNLFTAYAELAWQARATLTTPQVNEEVAIKIPKDSEQIRAFIGSQFCSLEYGDKVSHSPTDDDTYTLTAHDLLSAFSMAVDCAEPLPTPSPSNVLVEALRKIAKYPSTPKDEMSAVSMRKLADEALATYSASTDSVTISKAEYEAMEDDAERYRWLRANSITEMPFVVIRNKDRASGVRRYTDEALDEAIDTARQSS